MSWLNVELSWGCEGGELTASARATFDPAQSWWRPSPDNARSSPTRSSQKEAQLLAHEQLHFDLTEIAVRRIRKRFEELKDACAEPGGSEIIPGEIEKIDRDLQEEQRRYDRETAHGVNAAAQAKWAEKIRKLLN